MNVIAFKRILGVAVLLQALAACSDSAAPLAIEVQSEPYQYTAPPFLDDGWQVGHVADQGFEQQKIEQLVESIRDNSSPGIDSLTIVKNNTLVLHENVRKSFSRYDQWINNQQLDLHIMHSTSKSFVSALIGIAIEQGYIQNTETPFYQFFDYSEYANWDQRKQSIKLEDVLTMRLGLDWDEWNVPYGEADNSLTNLVESNQDFVKALLDLPLVYEPGSHYAYNTAASIALGSALENVTDMALADFAEYYLFNPLKIEDAKWMMTPSGSANTGSGLFLKTRDMAKLGQLYLDQGVWNGFQILSPQWIEHSLQQHVELNWDYTSGYGFQWWLGEFNVSGEKIPFYSSRGFGGQFIIVVPSQQLVVAFTAHNYENDLYELPFKLTEQFIIPAMTH